MNNSVYKVDFENNEISVITEPGLAQTLERINNYQLAYYYKGMIYSLNGYNWKYDSAKVPIDKFEKTNIRVWKKSNAGFAVAIAPIMLILGAAAVRRKRTKEHKEIEAVNETVNSPEPDPINSLKPITPKIRFNETERQLLKLLLDKSKLNDTTTITEINYALGIKDKNVGLQKKVRSDVMNSINEKFTFLLEDTTVLICNVRSQADKRYFEYFIEKKHFALLETMLKAEED